MKRKKLVIGGAAGAAAASIAAALMAGTGGAASGALPKGTQAQVPAASTNGDQGSTPDANSTPDPKAPGGRQPLQDVPFGEAEALAKTLKVTKAQAIQRLQVQSVNADKADTIDQKLGDKGAGSWLDPNTGAVQTNVLDAQAASVAKAAGATPHLVANSQSALDALQSKLDAVGAAAPKGASWGVDITTDKVVLTVTPQTSPLDVTAFLAKAGIIGLDLTKVAVHNNGRDLKFRGLIGGDDTEIYSNGTLQGWCSVGFLATRPNGQRVMLTAGHCTLLGKEYRRDPDHKRVGIVQEHHFSTKGDWSVVPVDKPRSWVPTGPYVNLHAKNGFQVVSIKGSKTAPIGAWVCKSGRTTGWTCGRITSRGWSGQIDAGPSGTFTVSGLTGSSICGAGGDSGGSVMWHNQAQGMVSAGPPDGTPCDPNMTDPSQPNTLFQPINPVLKAANLKLMLKR